MMHRHWHYHLSGFGILAAAAAFLAGALAPTVYHHVRGGFHFDTHRPPVLSISGGVYPASASLVPYLARVHNQGQSNSCVGQTLATIVEIETNEFAAKYPSFGQKHVFFRKNTAFSAGFIWNQATGGQDVGISYQAAFGILERQGDAPLATFAADGYNLWADQPGYWARQMAYKHRISRWYSISASDRSTIEAEIAAGRPMAIAVPIRDSIYNNWQGGYPVISADVGNFWFDHSMTIVGYTPQGVIIQNSWGTSWGDLGRAIFTWQMLAQMPPADIEIVVQNPIFPTPPPPPAPPTYHGSTRAYLA